MPVAFGAQEMTGFPLRTNICVGKSNAQNEGQNIRTKITLGDYSIGFHYERKQALANNRTITNLKWLGDGNQPYVTSFFEELLMLIRSKVLRNGGSLKRQKLHGSILLAWNRSVSLNCRVNGHGFVSA